KSLYVSGKNVFDQPLFTLKRPSAPPPAARGVYLGGREELDFYEKSNSSLPQNPLENQNTDKNRCNFS
ncbi:MAG: hypothetical protein ACI920_003755, partial [Saprospiraceae bacterium]